LSKSIGGISHSERPQLVHMILWTAPRVARLRDMAGEHLKLATVVD